MYSVLQPWPYGLLKLTTIPGAQSILLVYGYTTLSITVKGLRQRILKVLTQGMYKTNIAWQERELFKSFSKVVSLEDLFCPSQKVESLRNWKSGGFF